MENGVLLQSFDWFLPTDGTFWNWLREQADSLAAKGITALWLPPFSKGWGGVEGSSQSTVGYDSYDFWDLGYYRAHGDEPRTKYGTYQELLALVEKCHSTKPRINLYADLVFNHKMGAKFTQKVRVQEVDLNDKNRILSDWYVKEIYSNFRFPERMQAQKAGNTPTDNEFEWTWDHFDAFVDQGKVYRIKDKNFYCPTFKHHGDQPHLMGFDVDTSHPGVQQELNRFGDWLVQTIGIDGFRIDAVKHIRQSFFPEYLGRLRQKHEKELFTVAEYWEDHNLWKLTDFLEKTRQSMSLFDFRLRENFWQAANQGAAFNLASIFDETLVAANPYKSVTFVDNHDLQPFRQGKDFRQAEHDWFKPLAYALILLRPQGYPCVFYGDYFDNDLFKNGQTQRHGHIIDQFLKARKAAVGGETADYFDHANCIGWASRGNGSSAQSLAVVMSNSEAGWKDMKTTAPHTRFVDVTGQVATPVVTDENGKGRFSCTAGSVSVWLSEK